MKTLTKANHDKELAKAEMRLSNIEKKFAGKPESIFKHILLRAKRMNNGNKVAIWRALLWKKGYRKVCKAIPHFSVVITETRKNVVKPTPKKKAVAKKAVKSTPKKRVMKKLKPLTVKTKGVAKMKNSLAIQKALSPKVTEKMLDDELSRFIDLTEKQLIARISKIKSAVKLEAMRYVAFACRMKKVGRMARAKRNEIYA